MSTKAWWLIHKWTSLVCTIFLLLLCLTGLPLIFHEEIEHLTSDIEAPQLSPEPPADESGSRRGGGAQAASGRGHPLHVLGSGRASERDARLDGAVDRCSAGRCALRRDRHANGAGSRRAERPRLHVRHAQAARRSFRRIAGDALPRLHGLPLRRIDRVRRRALQAVHAPARVRHRAQGAAAREMARRAQPARHRDRRVGAHGRRHGRDQYAEHRDPRHLAIRSDGRDDRALQRCAAAHATTVRCRPRSTRRRRPCPK